MGPKSIKHQKFQRNGHLYISYDVERLATDSLIETCFAPVACFWTITTGRSGTEALCHALNSMLTINSTHEPWPALTYEGRLAIEGKALQDDAAIRLLHTARGRYAEGAYIDGHAYFECALFLSHIAEQIKMAFKGSRFIHLIRNPRDFVCSALGKHWFDHRLLLSFIFPNTPNPKWDHWQKLIWVWNKVHSKGLELEEKYGEDIIHRVLSEDLFNSPKGYEDILIWMGFKESTTRSSHGGRFEIKNSSKQKPQWNPAWDPFLYDVAGETIQKVYGTKKKKKRRRKTTSKST